MIVSGAFFAAGLIIGWVAGITYLLTWVLAPFAGAIALFGFKRVPKISRRDPGDWPILISFAAGLLLGGSLLSYVSSGSLGYPWHLRLLWVVSVPGLFLAGAGVYEIYWRIQRIWKYFRHNSRKAGNDC